MFNKTGSMEALHTLGLEKNAFIGSFFKNIKSKPLETLIGRPQDIFKIHKVIAEQASLKKIRDAAQRFKTDPSLWGKTKALGSIGGDVMGKAFTFGLPAYGIYHGFKEPEPGKTRGESIGRALGEGLGWMLPMGVLGMGASFVAPEYSFPGMLGRAGEYVGGFFGNKKRSPYPQQQIPPMQNQPMQSQPINAMGPPRASAPYY